MLSLTGAGDLGSQGLLSHKDLLGQFTIASLIISVVASIWTMSRLNHTIFDKARAAGTISDDQPGAVQYFRRLFFLVDPQRVPKAFPGL